MAEALLRGICAADENTKACFQESLKFGLGADLMVLERYREKSDVSKRPNWSLVPDAPVPPLDQTAESHSDVWHMPRSAEIEDVVRILEWLIASISGTRAMRQRRYESEVRRHYGQVNLGGRPKGAQPTGIVLRTLISDLAWVVREMGGSRLAGKRLTKALDLLRPYIPSVIPRVVPQTTLKRMRADREEPEKCKTRPVLGKGGNCKARRRARPSWRGAP
jgi:hypothetical protein